MKLHFRANGRPIPMLEVGDLVRLTRAESGPAPVAEAGELGRVRRISAKGGRRRGGNRPPRLEYP
jgi:hypothetical protein